jgi:hypothetical protein
VSVARSSVQRRVTRSLPLSSLSNHSSNPVRTFAADFARLQSQDQASSTDHDPRENFVQTTGVETYASGQPSFTTQFMLSSGEGSWSLKSRCLDENGDVSWVRSRTLQVPDPANAEQVIFLQEAVSSGPSAGRSYRSEMAPGGDSFTRPEDPAARLQELNAQFTQEWNIAG